MFCSKLPFLLGQFFVTHTVRQGSRFAEALFTVSFVLGVVTFEEDRLRVVFVRQDVSRDAVFQPYRVDAIASKPAPTGTVLLC